MAERELTRIEPLNGSNYQSWRYNVKLVLMDKGLWSFVQGTEEKPKATETDKKEKEMKEWYGMVWYGMYDTPRAIGA